MALQRRGDRWYVVKRINGRLRRESTGTSDREEAERRAIEILHDWFHAEAAEAPFVGDWLEEWIAQPPIRDRGVAFFGATTPIDAITKTDCERYLRLHPHDFDRQRLRAAFQKAEDAGWIARNPWHGIAPIPGKTVAHVLTAGEEAALLQVLRPRDQAFVILALHTGLRLSEMMQLRGADTKAPVLRVVGKGRKSRSVPVDPASRDAIRSLGPVPAHQALFPVDKHTIQVILRRAAKRAKIPKFRVHDLRHTFATRMAIAGLKPAILQKILGHSSLSLTSRYYLHVEEQDVAEAFALIAASIPAPVLTPPIPLIKQEIG